MRKYACFLAPLFLVACVTAPRAAPDAATEDPATVKVMVVGSYHMAGSNKNVVDIETESVLTPTRQAQLADIAASFAAFAPTVIATERETPAPDYLDPVYADYSDDMLATNANERVQVAYRLADLVGVERVYGIDEQPSEGEPDYFPFNKLMDFVARTGQTSAAEALLAEGRAMADDFAASQSERTMAALLLETNVGPLASSEFYYRMFQFDRGEDQPGAELQAYWFMRNAKIFSKLMQVTEPGDRVVVVYGAGHKFWLEHFIDHTPGFERVDPAPYLRAVIEEGAGE